MPIWTCDVYSCRGEVTTLMSWSNRRLLLCDKDTGFYRSIAGNHVHFEPLGSHQGSHLRKGKHEAAQH